MNAIAPGLVGTAITAAGPQAHIFEVLAHQKAIKRTQGPADLSSAPAPDRKTRSGPVGWCINSKVLGQADIDSFPRITGDTQGIHAILRPAAALFDATAPRRGISPSAAYFCRVHAEGPSAPLSYGTSPAHQRTVG